MKKKTTRRRSHKERRLRNRLRRQQAAVNETPKAPEGFMSDPVSDDPGTFHWEQRLPVIKWALAAIVFAALVALILK